MDLDSSIEVEPQDNDLHEYSSDTDPAEVNEPDLPKVKDLTQDSTDEEDNENNISEVLDDDYSESESDVSHGGDKGMKPQIPIHLIVCRRLIKKSVRM